MSEQLAHQYRTAATQLSALAQQVQAGSPDHSMDTAVRRIFDELISYEPSPKLRALLDKRAQQLTGATPVTSDAIHAAVQALNQVADNYEEQAHRLRGLWS